MGDIGVNSHYLFSEVRKDLSDLHNIYFMFWVEDLA
jgi:hypothetical protein